MRIALEKPTFGEKWLLASELPGLTPAGIAFKECLPDVLKIRFWIEDSIFFRKMRKLTKNRKKLVYILFESQIKTFNRTEIYNFFAIFGKNYLPVLNCTKFSFKIFGRVHKRREQTHN